MTNWFINVNFWIHLNHVWCDYTLYMYLNNIICRREKHLLDYSRERKGRHLFETSWQNVPRHLFLEQAFQQIRRQQLHPQEHSPLWMEQLHLDKCSRILKLLRSVVNSHWSCIQVCMYKIHIQIRKFGAPADFQLHIIFACGAQHYAASLMSDIQGNCDVKFSFLVGLKWQSHPNVPLLLPNVCWSNQSAV